jgi:hypothetical protein
MAPIKNLASQGHSVKLYKNLRTKVMKCCANIYFNRQCLNKNVIPKYGNIKVPYMSPATAITQKKVQTIRDGQIYKTICWVPTEYNNIYLIFVLDNTTGWTQ